MKNRIVKANDWLENTWLGQLLGGLLLVSIIAFLGVLMAFGLSDGSESVLETTGSVREWIGTLIAITLLLLTLSSTRTAAAANRRAEEATSKQLKAAQDQLQSASERDPHMLAFWFDAPITQPSPASDGADVTVIKVHVFNAAPAPAFAIGIQLKNIQAVATQVTWDGNQEIAVLLPGKQQSFSLTSRDMVQGLPPTMDEIECTFAMNGSAWRSTISGGKRQLSKVD